MKRLFKERKISRKNIMEFFDKKGFYIILILCVAVVGVTAVIVARNNITLSNQDFDLDSVILEQSSEDYDVIDFITDADTYQDIDQPIGTSSAITEYEATETENEKHTDVAAQADDLNQKVSDNEEIVVKTDEAQAQQIENTVDAASSNKEDLKQQFTMPVFGEIILDFAMDKLVYSKTLEDWRVHSGIDIAAKRGTPIKAVADGVVSEVKNDPRLGITIIIDHQNDVRSVYCNLASYEMVDTNQKVKQGEIIGSVGNTALFESVEQAHLHFEILKDNIPVDPADYLPVE